jgi:hypothetical protein
MRRSVVFIKSGSPLRMPLRNAGVVAGRPAGNGVAHGKGGKRLRYPVKKTAGLAIFFY